MNTRLIATALTSAMLATACTQAPEEGAPLAPDRSALAQELATSQTFAVSAEDGLSDATLVASGIWLDASPTTFAMDMRGGTASLVLVDNILELSELTIQLGDLDHELPGGSRITNITLVLEEPLAVDSSWQDHSVRGVVDVPFRLDWTVSTSTSTTPLASQDVDPVPVTLQIEQTADGLRLDAQLSQTDAVFELPDLFTVDAIDISIAAETR